MLLNKRQPAVTTGLWILGWSHGWMPQREGHMKKPAHKDFKKKKNLSFSFSWVMQCCWLQTTMQLPKALPKCHCDVSWHNPSAKYQPKGVGEPTGPLYIAAAVMSYTPAKSAGLPSSCLVKKKRLTFSLCQARNSICNLTSSSQLARHLRERLKKASYLKGEGGWFLIKLLEICDHINLFSSSYQMMPTTNTSHISQHFQVVSDAQHCFPLSLT